MGNASVGITSDRLGRHRATAFGRPGVFLVERWIVATRVMLREVNTSSKNKTYLNIFRVILYRAVLAEDNIESFEPEDYFQRLIERYSVLF